MTDLIKIPKVFYDDHEDRSLASPVIVKKTKSHYYIKANDPDLAELLEDARYYSDCASEGWDFYGQLGMQSSARATVKAIERGTK